MDALKVFISYRRADTQHLAGRLGDRIGRRFTVFMDIDDIPLGVDFTTALHEAVDASDVLLVLIGPRFFAGSRVKPAAEGRPADWVVAEVSAALERSIVVIPVLVDDTEMPSEEELPKPLWPLRSRQALRVGHASFNADVDRLVTALSEIEAREYGSSTPAAPARTPDRDALFRDPDYSRAVAAAYRREWGQAVELFRSLQERFPDDERVSTPLADATAADAEARGDWWEAVRALEALAEVRPQDATVESRLATARREVEIGDLVGQVRALALVEEWAGAVTVGDRIAALDPDRADPDGLVSSARARLQERDLEERYSTALAALQDGDHERAHALLEAIRRERPGYREVEDLILMSADRRAPAATPPPTADLSPAAVPTSPAAAPAADDKPLLASTARMWLVVASFVAAFALMVVVAGTAALPIATVGALTVVGATTVLTLQDASRLESSTGRAIRILSIVGAVAALALFGVVGAISPNVVKHATLYARYDGYEFLAAYFLAFPLVSAAVALVAGLVLHRKYGPAGVWPALIFLGCSLLMTQIIVGTFDA